MNERFAKGSGKYTCAVCGRVTRETGRGESSVHVCAQCYFEGGQENEHSDSHKGLMQTCELCQQAYNQAGYELPAELRWCDHDDKEDGGSYCDTCGVFNNKDRIVCRKCGAVLGVDETTFTIGLYLVDRAYGGAEEGGWWYDTAELIKPIRTIKSYGDTLKYCERLNQRLSSRSFGPNTGRRDIYSVLSEGEYRALWFEGDANALPKDLPTMRPTYS